MKLASQNMRVIGILNSVALGAMVLAFALVIGLRSGGSGGGGNSTVLNLTNTVEMGAFILVNFNPNTISGGAASFSNANVNSGFIYVSSVGVPSATSGVSFATLSAGGTLSMTRAGYYSGMLRLLVDQAATTFPAQSCNVTLFSESARPAGFYGSIPFVDNVRVASTIGENPATNIESAPFAFFYNGTLPIAVPVLVSCQVFGGSTVFAESANVWIVIDRENDIGGV